MPPSHAIFKRCRCKECTQEDASGISMDSQLMPAHLKCVQEEKLKQKMLFTQKTSTAHNTHSDDHSDDLASCLLALTLTDDGPDPKSCAHKLWNSQAEFQESSPSRDVVAGLPSIQEGWLCMVDQSLEILSNIEAHANRCFRLLLNPSDDSIAEVTNDLLHLRLAWENVSKKSDFVKARKKEVATTLDKLELEVKAMPSPSSSKDPEPVTVNTENQNTSPIERMDIVAQVAVLIGVVCSVLMGVNQRDGNFLMNTLSLLLFLAVEAALNKFNIKTKTAPYAVCGCHCTYAPTYSAGSAIPTYPKYCTHYPKPETLCGEPLLNVQPDGTHQPKKTFVYHDFHDYFAGLLSRGDLETMMDVSCDDLKASLASPLPRFVKTPFEAMFLREFAGPKAGQLFVDQGDEGRYVFALHVDFFNPEGMSVRGPSTSLGIISMACLNLPLDVRYKPENMYLAGIIPGPKQPSLENLNHYICPLIAQLATSWE
ncbi:hypothetical protein PISMIDRAFT_15089 [Pisolithus microcarpus 441]|uniref:Uncharacterized protein n=1 Tax=Pisolithus microcarpus 441 TaxID=765257 RepID=A0A0C9XYB4_9AGAM|nr:hypothetical protein PISMIDRAFT_15089 [Pisolithus microcarpus 441]